MQYAGRLFQDLDPATRAKRVQYLSHGVGVGVGACWRCRIQRSGLAVMLLSKRVRSTDQLEGRSGGARKGTAWGLDSPSWRCTKQNHRRGWREGATDEGKRSDASALVLLGLHLVLGTRTEGEPASALAGLALPIRLFFSTPPAVRTHTHVFAEIIKDPKISKLALSAATVGGIAPERKRSSFCPAAEAATTTAAAIAA